MPRFSHPWGFVTTTNSLTANYTTAGKLADNSMLATSYSKGRGFLATINSLSDKIMPASSYSTKGFLTVIAALPQGWIFYYYC